jgi:hypothetical protein
MSHPDIAWVDEQRSHLGCRDQLMQQLQPSTDTPVCTENSSVLIT